MVIGCLAAPWCYFLIEVVKNKFDLDDALDVFAVHGMGGYLGTLLIGVLADDRVYPEGPNASGKQFFKQLWGASFCAVYAFVVSFGLIKAINLVMPVLPPSSHLSEGLDTSIHGEKAYKENSQSGTEYTNPLKAAQAV
jgi:Amt family ammonium transporter